MRRRAAIEEENSRRAVGKQAIPIGPSRRRSNVNLQHRGRDFKYPRANHHCVLPHHVTAMLCPGIPFPIGDEIEHLKY